MLKEMTLLVIVLWGSQGMPTPTPNQDSGLPGELNQKAGALLGQYQTIGDKSLPTQERTELESQFSKPGCNFTELAEKCQIIRAFHTLFLWLQSNYPQEGLLQPIMPSFTLLTDLQESYLRDVCREGASGKAPQITCPKYPTGDPKLENMIHYIFELYRNRTENL